MNAKPYGNAHFIIINLMSIRINARLHFAPSIFVIYEFNLMIIRINGLHLPSTLFRIAGEVDEVII